LFWPGTLIALISNLSFVNKGYFLFSSLLALAGVSLLMSRVMRVRLQVDWSLPERSSCGHRIPVSITVRNSTKRTALDLAFRPFELNPLLRLVPETGAQLAQLDPGRAASLTCDLEVLRRGHYQLGGIRQECWFPFGVWRDVVRHRQPRTLIVYPAFHPLVTFAIPVGRKLHPGGILLSSNVGESTEFIGTREFRPGDNIKDIHWKSWARTGHPVVKEFQEEFFCRIALLLDTHVDESRRAGFEGALSLGAAIADQLGRGEYVVDLFAAGPDLYTLRSGRNLAHLDNVLDVLACLEPCKESPFERLAPVLLDNLSGITTAVVVLLDYDETRRRLLQVIRDHGPAIRVLVVRDGPCTLDPEADGELAGHVTVLASDDLGKAIDHL